MCDANGVAETMLGLPVTPQTRTVTVKDMTLAPFTLIDLRARREEILAIATRRGASNIAVFGSVARGETNEASRVDIPVDLEAGRSLVDLRGLRMDLRSPSAPGRRRHPGRPSPPASATEYSPRPCHGERRS